MYIDLKQRHRDDVLIGGSRDVHVPCMNSAAAWSVSAGCFCPVHIRFFVFFAVELNTGGERGNFLDKNVSLNWPPCAKKSWGGQACSARAVRHWYWCTAAAKRGGVISMQSTVMKGASSDKRWGERGGTLTDRKTRAVDSRRSSKRPNKKTMPMVGRAEARLASDTDSCGTRLPSLLSCLTVVGTAQVW